MLNLASRVRWVWDIVPLLLVPLACLNAFLRPVDENDMFIHILMGRDILSEWRLTGNPEWTYGPVNSDWVTFVHWPSQAMMALGFDAWGFGFFAALHAFLAGAFILVLYIGIRSIAPAWSTAVSQPRIAAAALFLAIPAVVLFIGPRANAIGALFAVVLGVWFVKIIYSGSFGTAWWAIPLTVWAWTLLHGASLLAAPIMGLGVAVWWASSPEPFGRRTVRKTVSLLVPVFLAAVAPLLTPLGVRAWERSIVIREMSVGWIYEWSPLEWTSFEALFTLATLAIGLASVGVLLRTRQQQRLYILTAASMLILSAGIFYQQRNYLILFPILAMLVIATLFRAIPAGKPKAWEQVDKSSWLVRVPPLGIFGMGLSAIAVFALVAGARAELDVKKFPVAIVQEIAAEYPEGGRRVFTPLSIAAEVPFYAPGNAVAFDARLDRYPEKTMKEASAAILTGREDWQEWLDSTYPGTTDLLLPISSPLVDAAREDGWEESATYEGWTLLARPEQ